MPGTEPSGSTMFHRFRSILGSKEPLDPKPQSEPLSSNTELSSSEKHMSPSSTDTHAATSEGCSSDFHKHINDRDKAGIQAGEGNLVGNANEIGLQVCSGAKKDEENHAALPQGQQDDSRGYEDTNDAMKRREGQPDCLIDCYDSDLGKEQEEHAIGGARQQGLGIRDLQPLPVSGLSGVNKVWRVSGKPKLEVPFRRVWRIYLQKPCF
jgi:hypothetical protein